MIAIEAASQSLAAADPAGAACHRSTSSGVSDGLTMPHTSTCRSISAAPGSRPPASTSARVRDRMRTTRPDGRVRSSSGTATPPRMSFSDAYSATAYTCVSVVTGPVIWNVAAHCLRSATGDVSS